MMMYDECEVSSEKIEHTLNRYNFSCFGSLTFFNSKTAVNFLMVFWYHGKNSKLHGSSRCKTYIQSTPLNRDNG